MWSRWTDGRARRAKAMADRAAHASLPLPGSRAAASGVAAGATPGPGRGAAAGAGPDAGPDSGPDSARIMEPGSAGRPAGHGAGVLRALLAAQIALAALVVAADLPRTGLRLWPGGDPAPPADVPVRPGDQTRRFDPAVLPRTAPTGPGFPAGVPSSLTFAAAEIGGRPGLRVTGTIQPGDGARFLREMEESPAPPEVVALHSPGGSVQDALEIGRAIRAAGIATAMEPGTACFSACPYILAAGTERAVSRAAMVGVHQHYFGANTLLPALVAVEQIQRGQGEVMDYLDAMGIGLRLVARALKTPPDDIYILLPEELEETRLATAMTD